MQHDSTENLMPYTVGHMVFDFSIIESLRYLGGLDDHLPWNLHCLPCVMHLFRHNMHQHIRHFALSTCKIVFCSKHFFIQIPNPKVCYVFVKFGNHLPVLTNDIEFQPYSFGCLNGRLGSTFCLGE